jgi:dienelactone hydrolase
MINRRALLQALGAGSAGMALTALLPEEAWEMTMPNTGSHIGTIYPFVEAQVAKRDYPLSFLNERFTDAGAWKREARRKFFDLLLYAPERVEPQPEMLERVDGGDFWRERVTFRTTPEIRVPAYVLIPKHAKLPAPGIVALHDHGGFYLWGKEKLIALPGEHATLTEFKKQYYGGMSIADELARQGYVVVVIDMFYWGDRRMVLDDDPPAWKERPPAITTAEVSAFNQRSGQNEQLLGRTLFLAGLTWAGVMFWDDIRTVDYLLTRPEVDRERIGCVGLSVGGFRSAHLAALDERIKAAVVVGWMCAYRPLLKDHILNTVGHTKLVPGLTRWLDLPDVAAMAIPARLLVINGRQDTLFTVEGMEEAHQKLAAAYKKAGVPNHFRAHLYDTPHEFNREMQSEAWAWLLDAFAIRNS